jgi:uncharacterized membrane-anchored protein
MKEAFTEIREDFDKIVQSVVEVNKAITRFESEGDSRFGMLVNRRLDELMRACQSIKKKVNETRREINSSY